MNYRLVEYIGYLVLLAAIGCGISLAVYPVMAKEKQAPIHGTLAIIGLLMILASIWYERLKKRTWRCT